MRRNNTYKMKRKAGFTLVEMIVVLVMLAILAAVAVPTYTSYVDSNKAKQCEVERKAIASRLEEMQTMQVTGSDSAADTTKYAEYVASQECPAGGAYTFKNNTIVCSHPEHGETTVLLKTDIGVTAKASTQTEAPKQSEQSEDTRIPTLSLSLSPNPLPVMEVGGTQPLTANAVPMYCNVTSYSWSVSDGNAIGIEGSGKDVTVHAKQAGEATITCTVNAQSQIEGKTVTPATASVTVKVNEKPVNLTISINPVSINMAPNASENLTAVVTNKEGCTDIDSYTWNVEPKGVIEIEESGEKVGVKATGAGSCTVTCTATAAREDGTGTVSATATASIVVQDGGVLLPEEILIPVWQTKNDADPNATVNTHIFEELLNYNYNVPKGGLWECDDPRVTVENDKGYVKYNESTGLYEGDNGYITIEDNDKAGRYRLTYTYKGTTTGMWAQVVYPIQGMHSSDSQVFSMELEDERQLTVSCEWPNTTDGPMEWSCKDNEIIEFSPVDGAEKNNKVTVRAASVGTTTLTASMLCHYNQATKKTPLYQTFTYTITVNYKTLKGATAEKLVLVEGGEPQQIQFTPIPSEGTDPNITYKYVSSNKDDSILSVTENGLVTPKKADTATVRFDAYLDGKVVCGGISCEIEIKADTSKVEVQGKKFNAASWEDLQEYLAGGRTDESFNRGGVYVRTYYEQWGAEQKELLVINPNASFEWKEEYENMTFEEFLNEPGIREQLFVPLNSNCIDLLANNVWYWAGPGSIAKRGEDLYVCIKQVDKGNVSEWPDGYLEEYFVKIA